METMQSTKKMTMTIYPAENGGAIRFDDGQLFVKEEDERFDEYVGRMINSEYKDSDIKAVEVVLEVTYKMQVLKGV